MLRRRVTTMVVESLGSSSMANARYWEHPRDDPKDFEAVRSLSDRFSERVRMMSREDAVASIHLLDDLLTMKLPFDHKSLFAELVLDEAEHGEG